jgi:hypothetical protein
LILDSTNMPRLTALRLVGRCCRNAFSIWAAEHHRPIKIKSAADRFNRETHEPREMKNPNPVRVFRVVRG